MAVTKGDQFTIAIRPSQLINLLAILLNTFTCRGRTDRRERSFLIILLLLLLLVNRNEPLQSQIGIITVIIWLITESNYNHWRFNLCTRNVYLYYNKLYGIPTHHLYSLLKVISQLYFFYSITYHQ